MSDRESGFVSLPTGGRLAFTVSGRTGAPSILLNRPLGGSMSLWGSFAERLGSAFRVVSFDPLGVGRSSNVPFLYSTRDMARDAIQVLDHLHIETAHVFGLSLGGMVASYIALDFTARVRSLTLASTIPEPEAVSLRGLQKIASLSRCFMRAGSDAEVALVQRILSREFRDAHPDRVLRIESQVREAPATRANLAVLAMAAARHTAPLQRLPASVPTLLVFGALDALAGAGARRELLRELPHATCKIISSSGHDISLEQPDELAACVVSFTLPALAILAATSPADEGRDL